MLQGERLTLSSKKKFLLNKRSYGFNLAEA